MLPCPANTSQWCSTFACPSGKRMKNAISFGHFRQRPRLVVGKTVGIAGMSLLGHCVGAPLPKGLSVPDLVATSAAWQGEGLGG